MANRSLFRGSPEKSAVEETSVFVRLSELEPGQVGNCFALLSEKQPAETRDGKPYYRCQFRDLQRIVTTMIWHDTSWFEVCEQEWKPGSYYRLRCRYLENKYGSQIEILQIRDVTEEDQELGFDPADYLPASRYDPQNMWLQLITLVKEGIVDQPLQSLVLQILEDHQEQISTYPAASRNHHAYRCGFLEHVLSVTRTATFLADKYRADYPQLSPPLSKDLVVAGAVLHDIGKLRELSLQPHGADYTAAGRLIGHILLGRDLVRDYAQKMEGLDPEHLLRLEHLIVAHQNLPEWGSPVSPHTPEALLVYYADDIDAKFQMMAHALGERLPDDVEFTSRNNALRRAIYRGSSLEKLSEE